MIPSKNPLIGLATENIDIDKGDLVDIENELNDRQHQLDSRTKILFGANESFDNLDETKQSIVFGNESASVLKLIDDTTKLAMRYASNVIRKHGFANEVITETLLANRVNAGLLKQFGALFSSSDFTDCIDRLAKEAKSVNDSYFTNVLVFDNSKLPSLSENMPINACVEAVLSEDSLIEEGGYTTETTADKAIELSSDAIKRLALILDIVNKAIDEASGEVAWQALTIDDINNIAVRTLVTNTLFYCEAILSQIDTTIELLQDKLSDEESVDTQFNQIVSAYRLFCQDTHAKVCGDRVDYINQSMSDTIGLEAFSTSKTGVVLRMIGRILVAIAKVIVVNLVALAMGFIAVGEELLIKLRDDMRAAKVDEKLKLINDNHIVISSVTVNDRVYVAIRDPNTHIKLYSLNTLAKIPRIEEADRAPTRLINVPTITIDSLKDRVVCGTIETKSIILERNKLLELTVCVDSLITTIANDYHNYIYGKSDKLTTSSDIIHIIDILVDGYNTIYKTNIKTPTFYHFDKPHEDESEYRQEIDVLNTIINSLKEDVNRNWNITNLSKYINDGKLIARSSAVSTKILSIGNNRSWNKVQQVFDKLANEADKSDNDTIKVRAPLISIYSKMVQRLIGMANSSILNSIKAASNVATLDANSYYLALSLIDKAFRSLPLEEQQKVYPNFR